MASPPSEPRASRASRPLRSLLAWLVGWLFGLTSEPTLLLARLVGLKSLARPGSPSRLGSLPTLISMIQHGFIFTTLFNLVICTNGLTIPHASSTGTSESAVRVTHANSSARRILIPRQE